MRFFLLFAAVLLMCPVAAEEIPLYPSVAPGSENWTWSETRSYAPVTHTLLFRNVVKPTLAVHRPPAGKANGTAVLVVPGGGFRLVVYDSEGNRIADWLNSLGITAFVLKYRVAYTEPDVDVPPQERLDTAKPLGVADAKQAMRIIRDHSTQYGVKQLGIMGFSAGGWIALAVAAAPDARPDFAAAIYPDMPPDLKVPANAPPLFLTVAADDPYVPTQSTKAFAAWQAAKIPVELHAYATGGHGFALKGHGLPVNTWNDRFADWMRWLKLLPEGAPISASQAR